MGWFEHLSRRSSAAIVRARLCGPLREEGFSAGRILDVGCARGEVSIELARAFPGAEITGLDLTGSYLALPQAPEGGPGRVVFTKGEAGKMPFASGSFQVVVCVNVLPTVPDPVAALREMERVLAPGGRLFIYCMRRSWRVQLNAALGLGYTAEEIAAMTARAKLRPHTVCQGPDWITITAPQSW